MQIIGLDGISNEEFADEMERGAKFVMYQWCISLVVVTLKQPTNIYFIRAGHSTVAKGLPWTFLSLIVGWWGIPFGIIYTIWVTVSNLSGGIDVTKDIMRDMRPRGRFDEHIQ